ncbi:PREDICTED: vam6/Vps39-like protein isoform X1 [Drosophila arizonae]|uniref:Vam6/Vps39-like protein isoform X1 n=1 Tax=Drosophila arizonae TaxID=7263 RepID=A0ABM1Q4S0_DROAR|nr:PREDICTED: vam6/Vps39-like protein isoform X1 [Drosophila arizonae]
MHTAYSVQSILKQGVQIEAITAFGNHVILGTRSGQLIMYSVENQTDVDMRMFNKNFSKKPITQMEVVAAENLLFVLTDNIIHVCDVSRIENNFEFMHSSAETKGCTLFTMDVDTRKSITGEVATFIRIGCAIKRRLVLFFWKKDKLASLELAIELLDVPKAMCWVNQLICVGYKDEYVLYDISYNPPKMHKLILTSSTISQEPNICLIRNSMLGISKDNYLMLIDLGQYKAIDNNVDTGMNRTTLTQWSSPLLALVWDEPFAVGRTKNTIEVRSLVGKDTLVQSIPELKNTRFLVRSDKGIIFAAASSELWCIRLVDIRMQRQELLQQKKFQLAIELTEISEEDGVDKAQTIRQIRMLYAKELFTNKEFAAAMKEFEKANIDPYDVIRLFPSLVPEPKNTTDAVVPPSSVPKLEDHDLENAYLALIEFLVQARQREVVKLLDTKSSSKSLLEIIDTTLLKCYLQTNDALVAPLLRLNQCHLEESEKMLKKHNKLSELIILYDGKKKHKKALTLLKEQANIKGSVLQGHKRTITYLQSLGSDNLPLIFEFADWVLTENPMEGLTIFTDELIAVEALPRAKVLDFLLSKHKALVIPYLEHIIFEWNDTNTLRHNALLKQYSEQVQRLLALQAKGEETPELQPLRAKMYKMLEESQHYSPDRVLDDFPSTVLLEERALILGRLKKHEEVLAIYIQVFGDVDKAKAYAEAKYEDDKEVFNILLLTILKPTQQPPYEGVTLHPDFLRPNKDVAVDLLNTYTIKIDPTKIIEYLPDDIYMHELKNYFETVARTQMNESHQRKIIRGLLQAEAARLRASLAKEKNKSFEINESTLCPECRKRFTNETALVRYPNGQVVHLSCYDRVVSATQQ